MEIMREGIGKENIKGPLITLFVITFVAMIGAMILHMAELDKAEMELRICEYAAEDRACRPSECRVAPDDETLFEIAAAKANPELVACADRMAPHSNWRLALAIAGAETDYCRAGVGRQNNCGGIRSSVPGRDFKIYLTACDGLEDIALTLGKEAYYGIRHGEDMDRLSAVWCGDGPECKTWADAVAQRIPADY
jgi:hypothetical protein